MSVENNAGRSAPPAAEAIARLQTRLGYQFADRSLLMRACTHRSRGRGGNERLEFLGDSLLGLTIAAALFARFPHSSEGELSRMRARLVCNQTLAQLARDLGLPGCLVVGDSARQANGREIDSILAGALEAIVGALYLDGDFVTTQQTLLRIFAARLREISPQLCVDAKTRLQEYLQKRARPLPLYEIIERAGKPNAPVFTVACHSDALAAIAVGSGGSRRAAEQCAAERALAMLSADTQV